MPARHRHGRTAALDEVTRALAKDGVIRGWRDEPVSVAPHYGAPELLRIERAASRHFGFMAYAAHLNGFTRRGGVPHAWISRRAATQGVDPGMLDNLVGGRIAAGLTVDETMRKEAWEEAGIPPALLEGWPASAPCAWNTPCPRACTARSCSCTTCGCPRTSAREPGRRGGRDPACRIEEVVEAILAGEFTLDAGAVMIDALLRQGVARSRGPAVPRPDPPAQAVSRGTLIPLAAPREPAPARMAAR